ncbi:unnamed protein product [Penicillium egyptiacum]|uniref:Uncharacterized protein n=1 Tax=Penicillium egyptiacum TaxID=1303716 RepID=A0A9W4P0X7_9EURO|nr:unnamed protein product [Penicillium egyptiacum]
MIRTIQTDQPVLIPTVPSTSHKINLKMSTESLPITTGAFAEAIKELPMAVLYSKVSELTNSIAHLHRSNAELRAFLTESNDSEEDKKELEGYITENEGVAVSMNERILLVKTEVENRGQPWIELDELKIDNEQGASTDVPVTNGTETETGTDARAGAEGAGHESNDREDGDGVYL